MKRKKLASGSFQQEVVAFLEENLPKSFTAKEILEETNKKQSKRRSDGSISGTLKVLSDGGWVVKSNNYPARYSYQNEYSHTQISAAKPTIVGETDYFLQSRINDKIKNIMDEIANLNNKIDDLQRKRYSLQDQLALAKELLSED